MNAAGWRREIGLFWQAPFILARACAAGTKAAVDVLVHRHREP